MFVDTAYIIFAPYVTLAIMSIVTAFILAIDERNL